MSENKTAHMAPGAESGPRQQHLDTTCHAWRVYYTPAGGSIPIFTGCAFTNAPLAAATAMELPLRKGITHIQHEIFGVVPHYMLHSVILIPSQHWGYDSSRGAPFMVTDHPKYLEWLADRRAVKEQQQQQQQQQQVT